MGFFEKNLRCVKPASTEMTPKASLLPIRTTKAGKKKKEIPAVCCHGVVNWAPTLPSRSGSGRGLTLPAKGPPNPSFPSGSLGSLEPWYRDVPAGFKLVQHFFPPKILLTVLSGPILCSAIVNATIGDIFCWLSSPSRSIASLPSLEGH